jgi:membrane-anchored glycerophosphoryl diester phosphodiesterase (GDPDase)
MEETTLQENERLYLSQEAQGFLKETAKWSYFLSIMGFVGIGFMVVLALFIGTIFSAISGLSGTANSMGVLETGFISGLYLVIALVYFFPIYYLFQFSTKMKKAFKSNDIDLINSSFEYLKSHYKFVGVVTLVFVILYVLIILFSILAGAIALFN